MTTIDHTPPIQWMSIATDGRWVYVNLPIKPGQPPCIMKFAMHEGGLWKALNILRQHSFEYAGEAMAHIEHITPRSALASKLMKDRGIL